MNKNSKLMLLVMLAGVACTINAASSEDNAAHATRKVVHKKRKPEAKHETRSEKVTKESKKKHEPKKEPKDAHKPEAKKAIATKKAAPQESRESFSSKVAKTAEVHHDSVLKGLATKPELSSFSMLLEKEGLNQALNTPDQQYTIFAPTNAALAKHSLSRTDLEHYIVEGKNPLTLRELEGRKRLNTLAHKQLTVEVKNRFVHIDGVKISSAEEIKTKNGIIYTIDQLLPIK